MVFGVSNSKRLSIKMSHSQALSSTRNPYNDNERFLAWVFPLITLIFTKPIM